MNGTDPPAGQRRRNPLAPLLRASAPVVRPGRWALAADGLLALVLAVVTINSLRSPDDSPGPGGRLPPGMFQGPEPPLPPYPPPDAVHVIGPATTPGWLLAIAALTALPLALRRLYPLAALWAVTVAAMLLHATPDGVRPGWGETLSDDTMLATVASFIVAAYGAALYSPYRRQALASLAAGTLLLIAANGADPPEITRGFFPALVLLPLVLAANAVQTWRQRVRALEAEREAATQRAVDRERSRIARELHDVVTHNVSVMVIQAGAARKVMDTEPALAREALLAVESGGRAAMAELRHVMGLLTMTSGAAADGPAAAELAPQPGLGQVADLARRVRDTGLPVELSVTGSPPALPAGADLAAYRVVQEGLTNAVKHAAGARVRVAVAYGPQEVRVEVADDGGAPSVSAQDGNGRGLIGLRERLAVYGGTLYAGRRPTGGFQVRAVIPVEQA